MKKLIGFIIILSSFSFSKVIEKKIEIPNGFYNIPAIYTYDDDKKDLPIVVMLHGTASNKNEVGDMYKTLAEKLIERGISSIRFDFIGTGDSKVDYLQYTLTSAVSDTNKVIEYAKMQTKGKIGLIGFSQGATISLLTQNKDISTIVTWSGTTDLFKNVSEEVYEKAKKNGFYLQEFSWRTPLKISLQWFEEAKNVKVIDYISKIDVPILSIAGKEDKVVNPYESVLIKINSQNKDSSAFYIPDANHIFNVLNKENNNNILYLVYINTLDWFENKLK